MLLLCCFYQVFTWICPICYKGVCKKCYLDLLKLLCIPRSLQNKTKLNFNQYSKDCWSFCFELMVLIESKRSMPLVHCAFGIVRQGSCLINDEHTGSHLWCLNNSKIMDIIMTTVLWESFWLTAKMIIGDWGISSSLAPVRSQLERSNLEMKCNMFASCSPGNFICLFLCENCEV